MQIPLVDLQAQYQTMKQEILAAIEGVLEGRRVCSNLKARTSWGARRMKEVRFGVIGWGYWGPKIGRNLDTLPQAMVAMVADMAAHHMVYPAG